MVLFPIQTERPHDGPGFLSNILDAVQEVKRQANLSYRPPAVHQLEAKMPDLKIFIEELSQIRADFASKTAFLSSDQKQQIEEELRQASEIEYQILKALREILPEAVYLVNLSPAQLQTKMDDLRSLIQKLNQLRVETQRSWQVLSWNRK
jgi:hypothetical protein